MQVAILGSGYVGQAICKRMLAHGHMVTLSTRSSTKLSSLPGQPFLLDTSSSDSYLEFLSGKDILLIAVAPGFQESYEDTYLHTANMISKTNPSIHSIVYLSSTSVYAEETGGYVDENSPLYSAHGNRQVLINTEKELLKLPQVVIFRLGEIYGPKREISTKLKNVKGSLAGTGERFTNMIHVKDIVSASCFSIKHGLKGIFNLVDDDHPTRRQLYHNIANEFSLPNPEWTNTRIETHGGNKRVENGKIKQAGYKFIYPHRVLI